MTRQGRHPVANGRLALFAGGANRGGGRFAVTGRPYVVFRMVSSNCARFHKLIGKKSVGLWRLRSALSCRQPGPVDGADAVRASGWLRAIPLGRGRFCRASKCIVRMLEDNCQAICLSHVVPPPRRLRSLQVDVRQSHPLLQLTGTPHGQRERETLFRRMTRWQVWGTVVCPVHRHVAVRPLRVAGGGAGVGWVKEVGVLLVSVGPLLPEPDPDDGRAACPAGPVRVPWRIATVRQMSE